MSYRGVQSQCDEHEEEDNGPQTGQPQVTDRLGVHDEDETHICAQTKQADIVQIMAG